MAKSYYSYFCSLCDLMNSDVCKDCQFSPPMMNCPSNYIPKDGLTWNWKTEKMNEFDAVSHPSHYTEGRQYEPRKVIHDWGLNFNLGNAVKYISRAGRKGDALEDLKNARQYLDFEIEEMEKEDK